MRAVALALAVFAGCGPHGGTREAVLSTLAGQGPACVREDDVEDAVAGRDAGPNDYVAGHQPIFYEDDAGTMTVHNVDGPFELATFASPYLLAPVIGLHPDGDRLFLGDQGSVRELHFGRHEVQTFAGGDSCAAFCLPLSIHVTRDAIYMVDSYSRVVTVDFAGATRTLAGAAGTGFTDGPVASARFGSVRDDPKLFGPLLGVWVEENGDVLIADTTNGALRKISQGTVTTVASRDAGVVAPTRILRSGAGLLVADGPVILAISDSGEASTWMGSREAPIVRDGSRAEARFARIEDLTEGFMGSLLVIDGDGARQYIRQVDPSGNVTTLATSNPRRGFSNVPVYDTGFTARSLAARADQRTLYFTDACSRRVRELQWW